MATTFLVKAWIGPVGPVGQCRNAEECVFFFASIIRLHYGITVLRMWRARNDPVYLVQVSASFFFFFYVKLKLYWCTHCMICRIPGIVLGNPISYRYIISARRTFFFPPSPFLSV